MSAAIRSMTGFGSSTRERDGFHLTLEMRSVNHRYLKLSTHLPEELSWAQKVVDATLRREFERGAISVAVNIERTDDAGAGEIDEPLLRRLHGELRALAEEISPGESVPLASLLSVDGVFKAAGQTALGADDVQPVVEEALEEAISGLRTMQLREGESLEKELAGLLESADRRLQEVEAALPQVAVQNREKYRKRLMDFLTGTGVELEASEILKEVAILAEKADVTEEVGRLRGHLEQYRGIVEEGGRIGRKLDFLTQEMFREANTMAAKVNHYELARTVVELKADIDRLREQTQNIE